MQEKPAIVGNEELQYLMKETVTKLTFYMDKRRGLYFWVEIEWHGSSYSEFCAFEGPSFQFTHKSTRTQYRDQSNRCHLVESLKQQTGREEQIQKSRDRLVTKRSGSAQSFTAPKIPQNDETINSVTMHSEARGGRKKRGTTSPEIPEATKKRPKKKKNGDSIGWRIRWEGIGMGVRRRNMLAQWLASARANWANARRKERERKKERWSRRV